MGNRAKVALLIDTATTWGSGLIEGIAEFANRTDAWQCFLGRAANTIASCCPTIGMATASSPASRTKNWPTN